jgi:muconolactone delta-isomerase
MERGCADYSDGRRGGATGQRNPITWGARLSYPSSYYRDPAQSIKFEKEKSCAGGVMGGLEITAQIEADISSMDYRLKIWGRWCRSGGSIEVLWETDDGNSRKLTTYEHRDSEKLQLMVMRLPILHRMTAQVHYCDQGDNEQYGARKKWEEVNARLRKAGEVRRISMGDYKNVWTRALRIMINSERAMTV